MTFGIWDPIWVHGSQGDTSRLPGTELLLDDHTADVVSAAEAQQLKRIEHKGREIILVPQPSEDPNDPLLWPRWQKEVAFWSIFFNAIIFAILPGPMLAPATFYLAGVLDEPLPRVAALSGYQLLVVGAFGPVVSVLAHKYGKRPQFLFAGVMATVGTAVCVAGAETLHYHTLLGGRIVQGLGVTAWESLAVASVGDLFYLHERGTRTAILVSALACTAAVVSVFSGLVVEGVGWQNLFVVLLPIDFACLLVTMVVLPETQYARQTAVGAPEEDKEEAKPGIQEMDKAPAMTAVYAEKPAATDTSGLPARSPYLVRLAPCSGIRYTDKSLPRLLLEIAIHLVNPAVWWILLASGVLISLFVVTAYILSQIWTPPPYNLGVAANGVFYIGAFIGGTFATGVGPFCDWTARALARRNHGVFEAEFRLPANILGALFVALGWFLFMWDVDHPKPHGYYLGSFAFGLVCLGISIPSTSAGLYILDAFPRQSTEIFVLQMMLKNFLFYAFSTFINTWEATAGPGAVFRTFGIVSLAVLATCIPMYIFGKVNRRFMHGLHSKYAIFGLMR